MMSGRQGLMGEFPLILNRLVIKEAALSCGRRNDQRDFIFY
jgi:hypothetical protein